MSPLPVFGDPRVPQRIWNHLHLDPDTGCWTCNLAPDPGGYCRTRWKVDGTWRHRLVHRLVYELLVGPIPSETLNHRCLNTRCANPAPAHAGDPMTFVENIQDAKARTVECPKGHPYDYANTFVNKKGSRECRQCMRDRAAAYRAKNPEKVRAAWTAENQRRSAAKRAG